MTKDAKVLLGALLAGASLIALYAFFTKGGYQITLGGGAQTTASAPPIPVDNLVGHGTTGPDYLVYNQPWGFVPPIQNYVAPVRPVGQIGMVGGFGYGGNGGG